MSSSKPENTTRKLSITVGGVLTFIVSLFLYRDLAGFLVTQGLATGNTALWDSLLIELILGAAAGVGAYFVVLKLLIDKGLFQQLGGIKVATESTSAKPTDQVGVDEHVTAAKTKLASTSHKAMMVVSDSGGVVGMATDHDFLTKTGERVKDIMTPRVISVSPRDDLYTAYAVMKGTGLTRLPVIEDEDGKKVPKGWISLTDVLKRLE